MMIRTPHYRLILTTGLALFGATMPLMAEESILWKSLNPNPAVVVPPYTGQSSPFPKVAVVATVSDTDTAAAEEQKRLRDKAFTYADQLIKNGRAMRPELRTVSVGGMVDGRLGARVLVNNQWVGVGAKVPVRQVRSSEAVEALKVLEEFDSAAYSQLTENLSSELAAKPLTTLIVQSITSSSMVLKDTSGKTYPVGFNINNE